MPAVGLALALVMGVVAALGVSPKPVATKITLMWDYETNQVSPELVFKLYSSTNMTVPLTNWTVLAVVPGTNRSVTLPVEPGVRFYALTASNWWGESDFSNAVGTPAAPVASALGIRPGE